MKSIGVGRNADSLNASLTVESLSRLPHDAFSILLGSHT